MSEVQFLTEFNYSGPLFLPLKHLRFIKFEFCVINVFTASVSLTNQITLNIFISAVIGPN